MIHDIIMTVASSTIISILLFVTRKILKGLDKHNMAHDDIVCDQQLLMKSQILDIYNRAKDKGRIGEHEKDIVNELFLRYGRTGNNGYIKDVVKKINKYKGD